MSSIKNKRIVIAGGSSGIGLATALMVSADGAEVIVTGRNPDKLQRVASLYGDAMQSFAVDISDRVQTDNFLKIQGISIIWL